MQNGSRDQHLEMITVSTNGTPELPDGDQLATYLASVGQVPGMPTYSVKAALQAVWEWGYQAGKVDAAADTLAAWDGSVPEAEVAEAELHRRFPDGSTDSKFNRTDGE